MQTRVYLKYTHHICEHNIYFKGEGAKGSENVKGSRMTKL